VSVGAVVSLQVPSALAFREVALEAVAAAVTLALAQTRVHGEKAQVFTDLAVRSAGEVFNIALHRHRGDVVHLEMQLQRGRLRVTIGEFSARLDPHDPHQAVWTRGPKPARAAAPASRSWAKARARAR